MAEKTVYDFLRTKPTIGARCCTRTEDGIYYEGTIVAIQAENNVAWIAVLGVPYTIPVRIPITVQTVCPYCQRALRLVGLTALETSEGNRYDNRRHTCPKRVLDRKQAAYQDGEWVHFGLPLVENPLRTGFISPTEKTNG